MSLFFGLARVVEVERSCGPAVCRREVAGSCPEAESGDGKKMSSHVSLLKGPTMRASLSRGSWFLVAQCAARQVGKGNLERDDISEGVGIDSDFGSGLRQLLLCDCGVAWGRDARQTDRPESRNSVLLSLAEPETKGLTGCLTGSRGLPKTRFNRPFNSLLNNFALFGVSGNGEWGRKSEMQMVLFHLCSG